MRCVGLGTSETSRRTDFQAAVIYEAYQTRWGGWIWRRTVQVSGGTTKRAALIKQAKEIARERGLPFFETARHNTQIPSDAVEALFGSADRCDAAPGGIGRLDAAALGDASCRDVA